VSWDSSFPEPIELPGGVRLASLREAMVHLANTVPSSERGTPVILTAAELITSAAERGGPIEFARIAALRAFNWHAERGFDPYRKDTTLAKARAEERPVRWTFATARRGGRSQMRGAGAEDEGEMIARF
jgi:hypothetical protein